MKFKSLFTANLIGDVIALIAGAILPFAFAPFGIYPLAILSPALLLATWLYVSPKRAFLRGWLFGIGFYGVGIYWVYISMHTFGKASIFFSALATVLLILAYGLYSGVQGYFLNRFFPRNNFSKILLAFPASWVLFEWIRYWFPTGFPWLLLGYSQINSSLHSLAPIIGVLGLSLAITFISGALVAIVYFKNRRWQITLLVSIILLWIIAGVLTKIQWTQPQGKPVKVSLVQGNISQLQKWNPQNIQNILYNYQKLTEENWNSDIIVWPECAIVISNIEAQDFLTGLDAAAKHHHTTLITGIPIEAQGKYYNGIISIGNGNGLYFKRHLLPFGDYLPMRFIFNIFGNNVQIPMSDWSRGPTLQPNLTANKISIAAFICYEIIFSDEVLQSLPAAQLLLSVSDDSWFGDSIAAAQHLQMAQMRSLETGRYLLFSTNTGITAIIDAQGKIQDVAPMFKPYVLTGIVQPMTGRTPYIIIGMYPIVILSVIFLLIAWLRRKK